MIETLDKSHKTCYDKGIGQSTNAVFVVVAMPYSLTKECDLMEFVQAKEAVQAGLNALIGAKLFPVKVDAEGNPEPYNLVETDPTILVDMGTTIENNQNARDIVFNALLDVLDKIVFENRKYKVSMPSLYVNTREFGGMMEFVRTGLSDVMDDPMWDPEGFVNYGDEGGPEYGAKMAQIEHGFYKPKVFARIYKKATPIMVAVSTARDQMFTAFHSWEQIGSFLDSLMMSVENTLTLKAELFGLMTMSAMIGKANALGHEVKLVTEYNALSNENLPNNEAAFKSDGFCRYLLSRILDTGDYFTRYSVAFNDGQDATFTPKEDNRLVLLSYVANVLKTGVRAQTFHNNLLDIGDYDKVVSWMGIRDDTGDFRFSTLSKVALNADAATELGIPGGEATTINNVIGVMYDKYSAAVNLEKKKVTVAYTAANDTFSHFHHSIGSWMVNPSHNIVYFTLN